MPADPARVQQLFLAALDLPTPDRAAYLDAACADAEVRARVEALIRAHDMPDSLLDAPVAPPPAARTITLTPGTGVPAGSDTGEGFELGDEIGRGANGVVFRARQRGLNRVVAVKMALGLERAARHALARFLAEAEAVAAISHPHVVRVYGFGQRDGVPFLAMEYLSGGTLADRLRAGAFDTRAAAELVAKVASGVAAAHTLGIVHRDLKPGNVLLDEDGEPKVTDFGLARRGTGSDLTRTHAVMGTPAYMAPEQARGGGKFAGPQADVWALGVILYECVAGKRPFDGETDDELLALITAGNPPALRAGSRSVPRDFDTIVAKCLSPEPEHRYPTAAELADDLGRFMRGEPILARQVNRVEQLVRWSRRKPTAAAAYGLSVLAVALSLVVFVVAGLWREAEGAKGRAETDRAAAVSARDQLDVEKRETELARLTAVELQLKAERLFTQADGARRGEEAEKLRAEKLAEKLARVEYGRTVQVAHQAWRDGDNARARALLESTRADLRGWEWQYARRLCADPLVTFPEPAPVELASWSPDGTRIFTAGRGMPPRIHDAAVGHLTVLGESRWGLLSAAWSKDGKRVLTVSGDNTVRVWDTATGKEVFSLGGARVPREPRATWSPDGTKVAVVYSAASKRRAVILDASGKELAALELEPGGDNFFDVLSIAWSPAGDRVAAPRGLKDPKEAVVDQKTVDVFDAKTGKRLLTLKGHEGPVWLVSFSPDGTKIVTTGDRTIRFWDAKTGTELAVVKSPTIGVAAIVWSPDGSRFLTTATGQPEWARPPERDHTVRLWDAKTNKELAVLQHPADVKSAAWSADGGRIVTAADEAVWVWDAATGKQLGVVRNRAGGLSVPSLSPDGTKLLTAAYDKLPGGKIEYFARVWDTRAGIAAFAVPVGPNNGLGDRRYWPSPDGFRALIGQTLWDARTGMKIAQLAIESEEMYSVAWSPDGTRFVTADGSKAGARVWDATEGKQLAALRDLTERVRVMAWNPDSTRIVIHTRDGTTKVWDAATGAGEVPLAGAMPEITAVEWSPDGSRVLASAIDGTLRVWDAKTGAVLVTPSEPLTASSEKVSWSPDRSRFVAGGWLWNANTGERIAVLRGQRGGFEPLPVWNRDGSLLAATDSDSVINEWRGNARIWDGRTGTEVAVIPPRDKDRPMRPGMLEWNPEGTRLALVTDGVRIWDVKRNKEVAFLDVHHTSIRWVAWNPDGKRIVTDPFYDDTTKTVHTRVWDAETGKVIASLESRDFQHPATEPGEWSPDGSRLATIDSSGSVRVWDAKTGKESLVFANKGWPPRAWLTWAPDNSKLAIVVADSVRVWDFKSEKEVAVVAGHQWAVNMPVRVMWTPDSSRMATADDANVRVWDLKAGKQVAHLFHKYIPGVTEGSFTSGSKHPINAVALSPDGTRIATASADHTVRLWDTATGKQLAVLTGHGSEVYSVLWTPDGSRLVTTGNDLRAWDAETGKPVFVSDFTSDFSRFSLHVATLSADGSRVTATAGDFLHFVDTRTWKATTVRVFGGGAKAPLDGPNQWWSSDGSRIAAREDGAVRVWDATTGKAVATLKTRAQTAVWSPDGSRIATTGSDSVLVGPNEVKTTYLTRIWDVRTATVSVVLKGHTGQIHAAVWNRNGTKLVTAAADGTARLYDAATGAEEAVLGGHAGEWIAAVWSPDGTRVATASNNTVRIWDALTGAELLMLLGEPSGNRRGDDGPLRWSPDGWRILVAPRVDFHGPEEGTLTIRDATPLDRPAVPLPVAPPRAKVVSD